MEHKNIITQIQSKTLIVKLNRPEIMNAIDKNTALELYDVFKNFEKDENLYVAIITGNGENFCTGEDLKSIALDKTSKNELNPNIDDPSPLGPTRLFLSKPVIAAISGYAIAGGLELACWADIRVGDTTSKFSVFNRKWGIPLIDGGTYRLPKLIGLSRALDLIITGREIDANEAFEYGLLNYLTEKRKALEKSLKIAQTIEKFPQNCLKADKYSTYRGLNLNLADALELEFSKASDVIRSGETLKGAREYLKNKNKK